MYHIALFLIKINCLFLEGKKKIKFFFVSFDQYLYLFIAAYCFFLMVQKHGIIVFSIHFSGYKQCQRYNFVVSLLFTFVVQYGKNVEVFHGSRFDFLYFGFLSVSATVGKILGILIFVVFSFITIFCFRKTWPKKCDCEGFLLGKKIINFGRLSKMVDNVGVISVSEICTDVGCSCWWCPARQCWCLCTKSNLWLW